MLPSHIQTTRSEEHTSELQSHVNLVCRLLLDSASTEIYTLSLHDALPIFSIWSPILEKVPSCRKWSSLLWRFKSRSAISSKNSVPRCALSTRPGFTVLAPVNAPFSYPNN